MVLKNRVEKEIKRNSKWSKKKLKKKEKELWQSSRPNPVLTGSP